MRQSYRQPGTGCVSWAVYRCEDAAAPGEGEQVERSELSRLVELAVFGFGQVQPPVDFLKFTK